MCKENITLPIMAVTDLLAKSKPLSKTEAYLDLIIKIQAQGQTKFSLDGLGHLWGWTSKKVRCYLTTLEQSGKVITNCQKRREGTIISLPNAPAENPFFYTSTTFK